MSYRKPRRRWHAVNVDDLLTGARYVRCKEPGCMRVRRARDLEPLIHKGRKPKK